MQEDVKGFSVWDRIVSASGGEHGRDRWTIIRVQAVPNAVSE